MPSEIPKLGIGGAVGAGKTALIKRITPYLLDEGYDVGIITNDLVTQEDAENVRNFFKDKIPEEHIRGVETGACPHTAIREDPSMNLAVFDDLTSKHDFDLIIFESGGDNLASTFSKEVADYFIFVIDVAEGEDIPRKRGPGITQCDLLVINKIDLAPYVDVDLEIIKKDAKKVRKNKPFILTNCKEEKNIKEVVNHIKQNLLK